MGLMGCFSSSTPPPPADAGALDVVVPEDIGSVDSGSVDSGSVDSALPSTDGIVDLCIGDDFRCVLSRGGEVACAGVNEAGQLGNGTTIPTNELSPVALPTSSAGPVVSLTCGPSFACVQHAEGPVFCWGAGVVPGPRGGYLEPERIDGLSELGQLVSGAEACLVVDGVARCWSRWSDPRIFAASTEVALLAPALVSSFSCWVNTAGEARCLDDSGSMLVPDGVGSVYEVVTSGWLEGPAGGMLRHCGLDPSGMLCWDIPEAAAGVTQHRYQAGTFASLALGQRFACMVDSHA